MTDGEDAGEFGCFCGVWAGVFEVGFEEVEPPVEDVFGAAKARAVLFDDVGVHVCSRPVEVPGLCAGREYGCTGGFDGVGRFGRFLVGF